MKSKISIGFLAILALNQAASIEIIKKDDHIICTDVPSPVLSEILGGAYNSRYMSVTTPSVTKEQEPSMPEHLKRDAEDLPSFYVEETHEKEIEDEPAWVSARFERSTKDHYQWGCELVVQWNDLGPDYFPRYLRSVKCKAQNCWYNLFKCKPRSFAVKLLRRKREYCVVAKEGTKIGQAGLPLELRDMWVWEERAVTFCCDCAPNDSVSNDE